MVIRAINFRRMFRCFMNFLILLIAQTNCLSQDINKKFEPPQFISKHFNFEKLPNKIHEIYGSTIELYANQVDFLNFDFAHGIISFEDDESDYSLQIKIPYYHVNEARDQFGNFIDTFKITEISATRRRELQVIHGENYTINFQGQIEKIKFWFDIEFREDEVVQYEKSVSFEF